MMRLIYKCGFCGKMTPGQFEGKLPHQTIIEAAFNRIYEGLYIPQIIEHQCDDVGRPTGIATLVAVLDD